MEIRILQKSDAESFRTLRLRSYQEATFAFSESYEDEKVKPLAEFEEEIQTLGNPPEWFILGAFNDDDQLIGFVKFRRDLRSKGRHKSMIHAMYTDPNYRKQGIGKKLIQNLLDRAQNLPGLEQIHLWVLHGETSAAYFYRSCGFEGQGPMVKKDLIIEGRYVDAEYMVMYLN